MTTTDNLGLNLPESNDYADVAVLNQNFQKLDAQALKAQEAKTAPADADKVPVIDSADASKTKLVLWSAIKTALSSVFAGITHASRHKTGGADALAPADIGAAAASHNHTKSQITDFPTSMTPTAHATTHATGGADALTPSDISAATKPTTVAATFTVAGWVKNATTNCYEQTVAVAGLLATDGKNVRVEPVGSTDAAAQALTDAAYAVLAGPGGYVACNTNGYLYARCPAGALAPTVAFQVAVVISR